MFEAMLACDVELKSLKFPIYCTPKLDGIRALKMDGKLVSRNWKPIRNTHIRDTIEKLLPDGVDGELIVRDGNFQKSTSGIMSERGYPDFIYNIFDFKKEEKKGYIKRMEDLKQLSRDLLLDDVRFIRLILPVTITNSQELDNYEAKCLLEGYEGVMIRSENGPYKEGRSTAKEGYLMKLKRFKDAEAKIIGYNELIHQDGSLGKTLGSLTVEGINPPFTGITFSIGGYDMTMRDKIWTHQQEYMGKIIKFRYQDCGTKDKPRFPIFHGFRDINDMDKTPVQQLRELVDTGKPLIINSTPPVIKEMKEKQQNFDDIFGA